MTDNNYYSKTKTIVKLLSLIIIVLLFFSVKSDDYLTFQTEKPKSTDQLSEILSADEYVQEINCDHDGLKQVSICFSTLERKNFSNLTALFCDENDHEIKRWNINCRLLRDNTYYILSLDKPIRNSNGKTFRLHLASDAAEGQGISVYTTGTEDNNFTLFLNNLPLNQKLCYRLTYKNSLKGLFSGARGFHVFAFFFLFLIFCLLIAVSEKWTVENRFLAVWLILGAMFFISLPLFKAPDEEEHFARALEISYGNLISTISNSTGEGGRELPLRGIDLTVFESWDNFSNVRNEVMLSNTLEFRRFSNTALYAPVSYIPQSLGILIVRLFTDNVASIAYGGRIMSFIIITLILYLSLRILPFGKEMLALIILMPMNLQEAISMAPDAMVVAVSILMISYVLYTKYTLKSKLSTLQILAFYLLAIMISLLKVVYIPFGLFYFLIPSERFGTLKKKIFHIVSMAFLAIISNLVWLRLCVKFLVEEGANSAEQLQYVLHHPTDFILILARSYFADSANWITTMIGETLCENTCETIGALILLYLCLLSYKYIKSRSQSRCKDDIIMNTLCIIIVISTLLLISTSLYIQFSPVYNNRILGIQGRYFIALLLPLFLTIYKPSVSKENAYNTFSISEMVFTGLVNTCAGLSLLFFCM